VGAIPGGGLDWQVSSLKWFCTSYLHPSTSEYFYIYRHIDPDPEWEDDVEILENIQWLELLCPFTAVKNLYLSKGIAPHIGPVLQELVGGSMTEMLPIVQNIFLEEFHPWGPVLEGIEFIAARRLSGQPITVSTLPLWERD
jgi:hypothetical protein